MKPDMKKMSKYSHMMPGMPPKEMKGAMPPKKMPKGHK